MDIKETAGGTMVTSSSPAKPTSKTPSRIEIEITDDGGGFIVQAYPRASKRGGYEAPTRKVFTSREDLDEYVDGLLGHED